MSYYNIPVSVRRILVINEYNLHKNFIQQNCTAQIQKYERRLRKSKRLAKLLRQKLLTMVELKSHMEELCDKGQCNARIKITRTLEAFPPTVTIEPF
jgi:hypothetical protein